MSKFLVQSLTIGGQSFNGPLDPKLADANGNITIGSIVSRVLTVLIPIAGVILLFVLIWGGYDFMMSQGNAEKVKGAQAKITTGLIGFVLLILSFFLVRLVAKIFGLNTMGIF